MADQELSEILSEYSNLAESEHQSFVATLIHSQNFAATVFSALQIYEDRPKSCDQLPVLCDLLFNTYRREPERRYFSLQFIPQLTHLLLINFGERQQFSCLETLLLAIHNVEAGTAKPLQFRIPSLSHNSIYHDVNQIQESRITSSLPEMLGERVSCSITIVERGLQSPVHILNSQNKNRLITHLFGVFCSLLGEYSRQAVEQACKTCSRMLTRGFNLGKKTSHRRTTSHGSDSSVKSGRQVSTSRLQLPSQLLLEMLQLAHHALHNGCLNVGVALTRDVEFRGRRECLASVLLVSRALLELAPGVSTGEEQRYITTPTTLSKNMITNASFRTKKLEGDIPRVDGEEGPPSLDTSRMSAIAEEGDEKEDNKKGIRDLENITDKIKARMEIVRMPLKKKDRDRLFDKDVDRGKGGDKRDRKRDKKERKDPSVSDSDGGEEIRLQNLPAETIAIHSPESGSTSIF